MAATEVKNINGDTVSQRDLPDAIFDVPVKKDVLHAVVRMQMASRRSGTASAKTRSAVKGSGSKLFRQKGTGRARRGDIKSPLLKGGGVVFGPVPRDYSFKVPKKVRRLALRMALTCKCQENELIVVDALTLNRIKTKDFVQIAEALGTRRALIVTADKNENLELSARNVPGIKVLRSEGINVYDILRYDHLILEEAALTAIEGRLA
ncbi:MAG: 50S ribosomal protein L4 [Desulfosudaceae bacterium]